MIEVIAYNGTTHSFLETDMIVAIHLFLEKTGLHSQDIKSVTRVR